MEMWWWKGRGNEENSAFEKQWLLSTLCWCAKKTTKLVQKNLIYWETESIVACDLPRNGLNYIKCPVKNLVAKYTVLKITCQSSDDIFHITSDKRLRLIFAVKNSAQHIKSVWFSRLTPIWHALVCSSHQQPSSLLKSLCDNCGVQPVLSFIIRSENFLST